MFKRIRELRDHKKTMKELVVRWDNYEPKGEIDAETLDKIREVAKENLSFIQGVHRRFYASMISAILFLIGSLMHIPLIIYGSSIWVFLTYSIILVANMIIIPIKKPLIWQSFYWFSFVLSACRLVALFV